MAVQSREPKKSYLCTDPRSVHDADHWVTSRIHAQSQPLDCQQASVLIFNIRKKRGWREGSAVRCTDYSCRESGVPVSVSMVSYN